MFNKTILRTWAVAAVCCTITAIFVYAMMPPESGSGFQQIIAYFLLPGVALYVLLNGSLLFGGGLGDVGNFLIIGLGSALAWSIAILFVVRWISWLLHFRKGFLE